MSRDALLQHLRSHSCLPFPAGPVVPREYSAPRPNDEFGSDAATRAATAYALLNRDYDDTMARLDSTIARANPKSALTSLMADAAEEFSTRHAGLEVLDGENCAACVLLDSIIRLRGGALHADAELLKEYPRRWKIMRKNGRSKPRSDLPYASLRYGCTCGGEQPVATAMQSVIQAVRALHECARDPFVTETLAKEGGDWLLLSLFFLKQFHSHLAWVPTDAHSKRAARLYGVMLKQLRGMARVRLDVAWSEIAAGLTMALPKLSPYLTPQGKAAVQKTDLGAPECFRPYWLGDRASSLEQACALLAVHGDLAEMALDADALALEMAARMTDPTMAIEIGLGEASLGYLANPYGKRAKALLEAANRAAVGLKPAGVNMATDYALQVFQFRVKRLSSYVNWMTLRGFAALRAQSLSAQPSEATASAQRAQP